MLRDCESCAVRFLAAAGEVLCPDCARGPQEPLQWPETLRLFDAPQTMAGQLAMQTDEVALSNGACHTGRVGS